MVSRGIFCVILCTLKFIYHIQNKWSTVMVKIILSYVFMTSSHWSYFVYKLLRSCTVLLSLLLLRFHRQFITWKHIVGLVEATAPQNFTRDMQCLTLQEEVCVVAQVGEVCSQQLTNVIFSFQVQYVFIWALTNKLDKCVFPSSSIFARQVSVRYNDFSYVT